MKIVFVGEPPYLEELSQLARNSGHDPVIFLPPDISREADQAEIQKKLDNVDAAVMCSVFSPHSIDNLGKMLPATKPIFHMALAESTTFATFVWDQGGRVVGWAALPPFAPPDGEKLVEVARGLLTADWAFEAAIAFWKSLGLEPVEVADGPGLVRARVLCCLINEAVSALADGVASAEDIDAAMQLGTNYPKGLLAWADELSLDVVLEVLRGLHEETGDPTYRPHPLLKRKVWAGNLGKISGRGFFEYDRPE
jgi:3-hydroxybutyryl-CoA dehydrogenase